MDNEKIVGLTLGIRYSKSFRIPDIAGDILDLILYDRKTPFGTKMFPNAQENSNRERTLYNPVTNDYLRINTDDIILGIKTPGNFSEKFDWLKNDVMPFYKDVLFRKFDIKNIKRIGVLYDHVVDRYPEINTAISKISKDNVDGAENLNISFSKKMSTTEAQYRSGVNDYKNIIYTILEGEENDILARLDYQYHYEPIVEDLRECFDQRILDDSKAFVEKRFQNWLIKKKDE